MDIANFHKRLLGTDPTPAQTRFYQAFPKHRGLSNEEPNAELFTATFISAISATFDKENETCAQKVLLMVPRSIEVWVIEQINLILDQVKPRKKLMSKAAVKVFVQAIKSIEIGTRIFTMQEAPKRWLAFGFTTSMPAPDWLKDGLLE